MKTAMQELIDELNELSNHYYTLSEYDTCHGIGIAVEFIMTKLEKEKEQLNNAYRNGIYDKNQGQIKEEYYNQTYNQNK
jgi:hypothetical protein